MPRVVEIDFMGLVEKRQQDPPAPRPAITRKPSLRDIQKAVSRMNPEVLRSVISSGSLRPADCRTPPPSTPLMTPAPSPTSRCCNIGKSPMTIFYNGTVSVFDLSPDAAGLVIVKAAEEGAGGGEETANSENDSQQKQGLQGLFLDDAHGDMPLARKKSLQRFMEKRKDRLTPSAPYPASSSSSVDVDDGHFEGSVKKEYWQEKKKKTSSTGAGWWCTAAKTPRACSSVLL